VKSTRLAQKSADFLRAVQHKQQKYTTINYDQILKCLKNQINLNFSLNFYDFNSSEHVQLSYMQLRKKLLKETIENTAQAKKRYNK